MADGNRRVLSHIEMVYRPGERDLALRLFEVLGLTISESHGYILGFIDDGALGNLLENMLSVSEITPEHWAFEQALAENLQRPEFAARGEAYRQAIRKAPQVRPHMGIADASRGAWQAAGEWVRRATEDYPELRGRLEIACQFRPGDPGSQSDYLEHAFINTDIVGTSCLALGHCIELQHYLRHLEAA